MHMKKIIKLIGITFVVLAVGCKSQTRQKDAIALKQEQASTIHQLEGTWELIDFKTATTRGESVSDLFPLKAPFFVVNLEESKIYGEDGCNLQQGTIKALGASTLDLMPGITPFQTYCEEVESMAYKIAFWKTKEYQFDNNLLLLKSEDHQTVLTYKRIENQQ